MWPFNLSVRLLIADLVGRYPANYLIRREPIFARIAPLTPWPCDLGASCGISTNFSVLSPSQRQVAHALLTRPPLTFIRSKLPNQSVRLECVMHAASVYPEPGSNSLKKYSHDAWRRNYLFRAFSLALTYFFLRVFDTLIRIVYFLRNQRVSALFPRLSLFNFQGPNFPPPFLRQPKQYTTSLSVCQDLFQNFSKNLFDISRHASRYTRPLPKA